MRMRLESRSVWLPSLALLVVAGAVSISGQTAETPPPAATAAKWTIATAGDAIMTRQVGASRTTRRSWRW